MAKILQKAFQNAIEEQGEMEEKNQKRLLQKILSLQPDHISFSHQSQVRRKLQLMRGRILSRRHHQNLIRSRHNRI
jgi:hypothetical protein